MSQLIKYVAFIVRLQGHTKTKHAKFVVTISLNYGTNSDPIGTVYYDLKASCMN